MQFSTPGGKEVEMFRQRNPKHWRNLRQCDLSFKEWVVTTQSWTDTEELWKKWLEITNRVAEKTIGTYEENKEKSRGKTTKTKYKWTQDKNDLRRKRDSAVGMEREI